MNKYISINLEQPEAEIQRNITNLISLNASMVNGRDGEILKKTIELFLASKGYPYNFPPIQERSVNFSNFPEEESNSPSVASPSPQVGGSGDVVLKTLKREPAHAQHVPIVPVNNTLLPPQPLMEEEHSLEDYSESPQQQNSQQQRRAPVHNNTLPPFTAPRQIHPQPLNINTNESVQPLNIQFSNPSHFDRFQLYWNSAENRNLLEKGYRCSSKQPNIHNTNETGYFIAKRSNNEDKNILAVTPTYIQQINNDKLTPAEKAELDATLPYLIAASLKGLGTDLNAELKINGGKPELQQRVAAILMNEYHFTNVVDAQGNRFPTMSAPSNQSTQALFHGNESNRPESPSAPPASPEIEQSPSNLGQRH